MVAESAGSGRVPSPLGASAAGAGGGSDVG